MVTIVFSIPQEAKRHTIIDKCEYCLRQPVWYENLSGVVICPDKSRHKHRWSG